MNQGIGKLILLGGLIGAGYFAYNKYSRSAIPLHLTRKILQQIKHQILIVSINYAEGTRQTLAKIKKSNPDKEGEVIEFFRNKMTQVYTQKQQLILGKYDISRDTFSESLTNYNHDQKIKSIQDEIIDMMDRAVRGEVPNLDVDPRVTKAFPKQKILLIYEEMSKMILATIITKFQKELSANPNFDTKNQNHFKKAIRQLNIYDKKVEFFKNKGFSQQWGCPNENFFKLSEGFKLKYPDFKQDMRRLQKIYEEIVDIATQTPTNIKVSQINDYYNRIPELPTVNKHEPQQNQYFNLNSSTRSEPNEEDQSDKIQAIPNALQKHEIHRSESLKIQHEELHKPKGVEQSTQKQVKIQINDVPNDALSLQKEMGHKVDVANEVGSQQPLEVERADSNVSVDGDAAQPLVQNNIQKKTEKEVQNTQS